MANEREEALKKMLVSTDFKEETYQELQLQEIIILKNSAENMKGRDIEEKAKQFFAEREKFFLHLILRKIPTLENLFVLFTKVTNLPYIVCDDDTQNDQVFIYDEERFAQKHAVELKKESVELNIVKIDNKQFLQFYTSLFGMGVNELVLDKGVNSVAFDLDKLVKAPDYSQLEAKRRPVQNPELVLTACYFSQQNMLPAEKRDAQTLKDLEEEMLANLTRGRVLIPVILPEGEEKPDINNLKIPFLKMQNGDSYQPVCSDQAEFTRFNRENKLRAFVIDGQKLGQLVGNNAKGIMLNPTTFKIIIPKAKL